MKKCIRPVLVAVLLLTLGLAGCASGTWTRYELYMGQTSNGGKTRINSKRWQGFLSTEVTPKFSDGYTVYDALGFWGSKGRTYSERSKVIMIVSEDKDAEKRVDEIAKAYKDQFEQESVLKVIMPVDVEFK